LARYISELNQLALLARVRRSGPSGLADPEAIGPFYSPSAAGKVESASKEEPMGKLTLYHKHG
jgi:hypothetical protein